VPTLGNGVQRRSATLGDTLGETLGVTKANAAGPTA
jgi:hypothetical protein